MQIKTGLASRSGPFLRSGPDAATTEAGLAVLRLVLGDQLSDDLSALKDLNPDVDTVLMTEVRDEATYVRHHKQKLALVFAAMRNHDNKKSVKKKKKM